MKKYEEVKLILEKNKEYLMSLEGVHTFGIGYSTDEEHKDKLSIHIYIESEEKADKLLKLKNLSVELETVPVSIIIEPHMSLDILYVNNKSETATIKDETRYRPLKGGIQLYLENQNGGWAGTLGTFVKSKDTSNKDLYILSNLHVLDALDRAVYQPTKDKKDKKNSNFIAVTTTACSYRDTDAALAKINDGVEVEINTIEGIGKVDEIKTIDSKDLGKTVIKRGRTTLLTEGKILTISAYVYVEIAENISRWYRDCINVKAKDGDKFSDKGDSGSCVVLKEENKLVGLHFSGNKEHGTSTFCKIDHVFTNLNVELPKG